MLVPFSDSHSVTASSFNLFLNLHHRVLPASSLIDGVIQHIPRDELIGLNIDALQGTVIVCTEYSCVIWNLVAGTQYSLCEDKINLFEMLRCFELLFKDGQEGTLIVMGLYKRIEQLEHTRYRQIELMRKVLCRLHKLADQGVLSIIVLRFCTLNRGSWGGRLRIPRHPIQHFCLMQMSFELSPTVKDIH